MASTKQSVMSWIPILLTIIIVAAIAATSQLNSTSTSETIGIISDHIRFLYQPTATPTTNHSQIQLTFNYLISEEFIQSELLSNFTLYNLAVGIILAIAAYYIHRVLFTPYALVRNFGDVGYITDGQNKRDAANDIRKRRRAGDVPPVYPNGWFSLLRSWELKVKDVKYVSALGQEFAVYRGEDGKAYIVDAYCPHLGANLGVGGQVKGDCIECPFHGWTFRGSDGKCMDVPYSKKVPEFAKTKVWRSLERNGEIFVWFHAEGEEPGWTPPAVEGIEKGELIYHGYTEHMVNAHIEEIPENGADIGHLYHLHTPFLATGTDLRYTFSWTWEWIKHVWDGGWRQHEEDKHVGIMSLHHSITVFGHTLPLTSLLAEAHQTGPGVVYLRIFLPVIGEILMMHCVTPLEPLTLKVTHTVFAPWYCPRWAAKFVLWAESVQIERDLMIWNHKTYKTKPLLVKEDSLIAKHRRWYSQFYSENSPRYSSRKEGLDW